MSFCLQEEKKIEYQIFVVIQAIYQLMMLLMVGITWSSSIFEKLKCYTNYV
jgi:hypothetical protein